MDAYRVPGASVMAQAIEDAEKSIRKLKRKAPTRLSTRFPAAYEGSSAEEEAQFLIDGQIIAAYETRSGRRMNSLSRCAHMLTAGKVMQAIGTLPPPLQHLGHFLHSPMATGVDQNRAHSLLYFSTDLPKMHRSRQEAAYWVALAALFSWRGMVWGAEEWWPGKIADFVRGYSGIRIDPSNWARDWADVWDLFLNKADELEAKALVPVAALVARQNRAA